MRDSAKRDLDNNLNSQTMLEERRQNLQDRLAQLDVAAAPFLQRLAELQAELDGLLLRYSEVHPDVVRARRELEDLQSTISAHEESSDEGAAKPTVIQDPQVAALQEEIADVTQRLDVLRKDEPRLRGEIRKYDRRIAAVPRVEPQLTRLLNEHNMLQKRWRTLQEKADRARESQLIEEELMGEQFELVQRAGFPSRPVSPNPAPIIGLSLISSCLLFVGPLMVRRLLNPVISSEAGLRALVDVPLLVSLPRVITPRYKGHVARRFAKNLGFSVVFAVVLAAVVLYVGRDASAGIEQQQRPAQQDAVEAQEDVSQSR
jgi:uncharacterized protein involved in exopolysaccharide biosynthesis